MNRTITLRAATGDSTIYVGPLAQGLQDILASDRSVFLIEECVAQQFLDSLPGMLSPADLVRRTGGEQCKDLVAVEQLYQQLFAKGVDRSTVCLAAGGGAFLDLVGFVAATYLRGIKFVAIPTTLLAQVDASVGGKNGVDYRGYKNLIGTIRQPSRVVLDVQMLNTLPAREFRSGLAEVVKAALIADRPFFEWLEANHQSIISRDRQIIEEMVARAVAIKVAIVEKDEHEQGERRKLNFGHTIGHALEVNSSLLHGEAVSVGMVLEAHFARVNRWTDQATADRLERLLQNFALPTTVEHPLLQLAEALSRDKKRDGALLHLPIVPAIGNCHVREVSLLQLCEYLR